MGLELRNRFASSQTMVIEEEQRGNNKEIERTAASSSSSSCSASRTSSSSSPSPAASSEEIPRSFLSSFFLSSSSSSSSPSSSPSPSPLPISIPNPFEPLSLPPPSSHPLSYENLFTADGRPIPPSALFPPLPRSSSRVFSLSEVAKHNKCNDIWLVIKGKVYDVSRWVSSHPGGDLTILGLAGKDCTDSFTVFHPHYVIEKLLPLLQIGVIEGGWKPTSLQSDFHEIIATLEKEGRFKTDHSFYWKKIALYSSLLALVFFLVLFPQSSFYLSSGLSSEFLTHGLFLLGAVSLGMFFQQWGFVGHDFGHNSVYGTAQGDLWGSLATTLFFGVSGLWWKRNHNVHHIHTNSRESDPDIQHLPFLAVDERLFKPFWSSYYGKKFVFDAAAKFFVSHQHMLYYLSMAVARLNLFLQSFFVCFNPNLAIPLRRRALELAALALYWLWFSLLLSLLPAPSTRYYFFAISNAVAGLLHVQITLSHFAMPTYAGPGHPEQLQNGFLLTQFATTMNVLCGTWMDWFHGGLHYQLEHHLLPRLPRQQLRHVSEHHIKPLAKKHGLHYHGYSFLEGNRLVYETLKQQAMKARAETNELIQSDYLMRFLNADG